MKGKKKKKKKKTRLRCSMEVKIVNQPRQRHPATRWAKSQIDISDLDIVNKTVEGSVGNWRKKTKQLDTQSGLPSSLTSCRLQRDVRGRKAL